MRTKFHFLHRTSWFRFLILAIVTVFLTAIPVCAAERLYFSYGLFERSVSVSSLEAYAKDRTVNADLGFFLNFLDSETREGLQKALNATYHLSPVAVSQSFYDPIGETSLRYIGRSIQTGGRQNGLYALRAALVQAAAAPDGFTILDVLRQFPTEGMRIDLKVLVEGLRAGKKFLEETNRVIDGVQQLAQATTETEIPIPAEIPGLNNPGSFQVSTQTIILRDEQRDRVYPADLYLPEILDAAPASIPVVVISHGLGSSRRDFSEIAQHFASHGFAAVLPEHTGSNNDLQRAVLAGRANEFFRAREFVDRPLDVTYLLDELERRNQSEWQGRLNLKEVAVGGHSFGGYTALVLGGATADFENLHRSCNRESFIEFLNPALLLQCRALELEASDPGAVQQLTQGLQDPRVRLVIAVNPVNSIILGEQGLSRIQLPTVMVSSGFDPAAPIIPEQAHSFTWLTAPEKYLIVVRGASHSIELTTLINRAIDPSVAIDQLEEEVRVFRTNLRALLLAFLQVYLNNNSEYRAFLQPFYVETLDDPPFEFSLIRSLSQEQLSQMINGEMVRGEENS
jgi:predicted dienelactone hydrolase